jgi:hypothetical protein
MGAARLSRSLAALLAAGCASFTPGVGKEEKPTGKEAYLYGRFHINTPAMRLTAQGHQTIGLLLQCTDNQSYTIKFQREEALQVVKISPSTCNLAELVYSDADGFVNRRQPAPAEMRRAVAYQSGKAYYLGDYRAEAGQTPGWQSVRFSWRINSIIDNYSGTTQELKAGFPNLSTLPTEKRMLGR